MKLGTQSNSTKRQRYMGWICIVQNAEAQIKKMQSHCPASQKAVHLKWFESVKHRIGMLRLYQRNKGSYAISCWMYCLETASEDNTSGKENQRQGKFLLFRRARRCLADPSNCRFTKSKRKSCQHRLEAGEMWHPMGFHWRRSFSQWAAKASLLAFFTASMCEYDTKYLWF